MDERQGRIIIGVTIGVLIIIISILIYIGVTTGTKKDQFLKTADEFEKAGEQYFHDEDILPTEEDKIVAVPIEELIKKGYLKENQIKGPNGENCTGEVIVILKDGEYIFDKYLRCGKYRYTYETEKDKPTPGQDPNKDPGTTPGQDPNKDPGTTPGQDPNKDPGTTPGKDPGKDDTPSLGELLEPIDVYNNNLIYGRGADYCSELLKDIILDEEATHSIKSIEELFCIRVLPDHKYRLDKSLDFLDDNSYLDPNNNVFGDINKDNVVEGIKAELTKGKGYLPMKRFNGKFNGNQNTINNLLIRETYSYSLKKDNFVFDIDARDNREYIVNGLFGELGGEASVSGLKINNAKVYGYDNVGIIASLNYGSISGITITNSEVKGSNYVGGIVGKNAYKIVTDDEENKNAREVSGKIGSSNHSSNIELKVHGETYIGGVAGINNGTIQNITTNNGLEVSGIRYVGGIVGSNRLENNLKLKKDSKATILNLKNISGKVSGQNAVGGIAGSNDEGGNISNSSSKAKVSNYGNLGGINIGGLVGVNSFNAEIHNSSSSAEATGSENVGGLVGQNNGLISRSFSVNMKVFARPGKLYITESRCSIAEIFLEEIEKEIKEKREEYIEYVTSSDKTDAEKEKKTEEYFDFLNKMQAKTIKTMCSVGGLVGANYGKIERSYVEAGTGTPGNATTYKAEDYDGNILKDDDGEEIVLGIENKGGLVGFHSGTISDCYYDGNLTISKASYVGGLVGKSLFGNIKNSYSKTTISGDGIMVGGLVGFFGSHKETLENSYTSVTIVNGLKDENNLLIGLLLIEKDSNKSEDEIVKNSFCYKTGNTEKYCKYGELLNQSMTITAPYIKERLKWSSTIWNLNETTTEYPKLR